LKKDGVLWNYEIWKEKELKILKFTIQSNVKPQEICSQVRQ
jgi:hypothetical protein